MAVTASLIPSAIVLVTCLVVPSGMTPLIATVGVYACELTFMAILDFLRLFETPSCVERIMDGKGQYLLVPLVVWLAGFCAHYARVRLFRPKSRV